MALALMRRHRRWLFAFLWVVIIAFVILYIPPLLRGTDEAGGGGVEMGKVGELPISQTEFQRSYLRQRQVYERLYQGRRLDPGMLHGIESQVFDQLVAERLVSLEARRLGLSVDDDALARAVATLPEFQQDGKYIGSEEIRRQLDRQGISTQEFEESLRQRLLREKLEALVTDAVTVGSGDAEREFRRRTEQVRLEYVQVDAASFRSKLTVSDDDVKARFEAHKAEYRIPERRVVSYVLVDPAALQAQVTVTDADLGTYYEQHREDYRQPEEACAGHILIKVKGPTAPKAIRMPKPRRSRPASWPGSRREATSRRSPTSLPRTRAPPTRAETCNASAGAAWCPSSRTPSSASSPARPRSSSRRPSATTSSG
jgi:peptidyl-prolyl cis-trans isomerase D